MLKNTIKICFMSNEWHRNDNDNTIWTIGNEIGYNECRFETISIMVQYDRSLTFFGHIPYNGLFGPSLWWTQINQLKIHIWYRFFCCCCLCFLDDKTKYHHNGKQITFCMKKTEDGQQNVKGTINGLGDAVFFFSFDVCLCKCIYYITNLSFLEYVGN